CPRSSKNAQRRKECHVQPYHPTVSAILKMILISLSTAGFLLGQGSVEPQHVPGRVLVKFRSDVSEERGRAILERNGVKSHHLISEIGVYVVELPPFANEAAAARALREQGEVEFAELDRMVAPSTISPNDPYFPFQGE